jgi:hypothetical protein
MHKPIPTNPDENRSPSLQKAIRFLKKVSGDNNPDITNIIDVVTGEPLCHHDATHILVSTMPPVNIGGYQVTGINGVNVPMFHFDNSEFKEEYSGILDEARVAVEQFCASPARPSAAGRMAHYVILLKKYGIDACDVLKDHVKAREEAYGVKFGEAIDLNAALGSTPNNTITDGTFKGRVQRPDQSREK